MKKACICELKRPWWVLHISRPISQLSKLLKRRRGVWDESRDSWRGPSRGTALACEFRDPTAVLEVDRCVTVSQLASGGLKCHFDLQYQALNLWQLHNPATIIPTDDAATFSLIYSSAERGSCRQSRQSPVFQTVSRGWTYAGKIRYFKGFESVPSLGQGFKSRFLNMAQGFDKGYYLLSISNPPLSLSWSETCHGLSWVSVACNRTLSGPQIPQILSTLR
jgi:hypothetical protein